MPGARSLYLLDLPFLHFAPLAFDAPEQGRLRLTLDAAYANTFSHTWHARALHVEEGRDRAPFTRAEAEVLHGRHPDDVIAFLDAEVTRVALKGEVALGGGAVLGLEVPWLSFTALHADGAIEGFHSALGLSSSQRDFFPRGRFEVVQQRPRGALEFQDETPPAGLGDAVLSARLLRDVGAGTRVAVEGALKLPTGDANAWRGSGSLDAGLAVGARRALSRSFAARLEMAGVLPGRFRGDGPATFSPSPFLRLLGALAFTPGERTALSLAAVLEQSPERRDDRGDAGRTSVEVTLGVSHHLSPRVAAALAVTENVPRYGDAADLALRLSLRVLP